MVGRMTYIHHITRTGLATALLVLLPSLASAACFASYKAKQEDPLRLHFGVAQVPDSACTKAGAAQVLAPRLANDGWILLTIDAMVDETELEALKDSAGAFFLKYK